MNPSPLFQIRLEQDVLTMHGSQTESVGCFLRGQLILALTETIKVREIRLTFKGKSKISWTDDKGPAQYHHSERRTLFQHDWIFLPAEKNYHVLKPDNYQWDFELVLPGTLPETIDVCEKNNYINYTLKAIAERHTFATNLQTRRTVKIQRCLLPTSLDLIQSVVVSNVWVDKVDYELSIESKIFSLGDKIPVSIKFTPLQESLRLKHITCALKEHVTYQIGAYSKTETKTIAMFKDIDSASVLKNEENGLEVWTKSFGLPIPSSSDHCLFDSDSFLKIKHRLRFSIAFQAFRASNKEYSAELEASMPVIITCVSPTSNDDNNNLSTSFSSHSFVASSNSNSPSEGSPEIHHNTIDNLFDIEILNRLPPYQSIANEMPAPLTDSILPPG
nr:12669_t:CDS:2 [Entrophospora candida]